MRFFFNDYNENVKAPKNFITKFMISLDSSVYDIGDRIIECGQSVDNLCCFFHGRAEMIGHWKDRKNTADDPIKVRVVELSEGSWFGDY